MSIFREEMIPCPACATPVEFALVHSVAADRRPELRDAILDGSFQREACPSCGTAFRVEPEFVYMDIARCQYIGVWPVSRRREWQRCAAETREVFDRSLGERAPPEAREIGVKLAVRVVFGWPALREKILARDAGIDDRTLEAAKVASLRGEQDVPLPGRRELRLVALRDGDALLGWVTGDESPGAADEEEGGVLLRVPRDILAAIEADPQGWAALREAVAEGDVVDFQREALAAA